MTGRKGVDVRQMIELCFIYNGYQKCCLGKFTHIQEAIHFLKEHQFSQSAINNPRFRKSMSGETIRIDYGAVDCYYLITVSKEKEKKEND